MNKGGREKERVVKRSELVCGPDATDHMWPSASRDEIWGDEAKTGDDRLITFYNSPVNFSPDIISV